MDFSRKQLAAIAAFLAVLAGGGTFVLVAEPDDKSVSPATVTVAVPPPAAPMGELQTTDVQQLRDSTPDDVPAGVLEAADEAEADKTDVLPPTGEPLPVGGAQGHECRNDYATRGFRSGRADKVMSYKLHYAVAPNRPGWSDVDGVGDFLERAGLSTHDVIDFEGNCEHKVRYSDTALTQGRFNPTSESVEIIATGQETRTQWLASPLIRDGILASLVRDRLRARGLPLRFVDPIGCQDRLGYTDHNHLECGNDHHDVAPNFPFAEFQRQLAIGPGSVTITDRVTCRKLNSWRNAGRPHGGAWERHSVRRKRALTARGVTCTARGPVKA